MKIRILLLGFLLALVSALYAQVEMTLDILPFDRMEYTCEHGKTDFYPTDSEALQYLYSQSNGIQDYIDQYSCNPPSVVCMIEPIVPGEVVDEGCSYNFTRKYHVYFDCDGVSTHLIIPERFTVFHYNAEDIAEFTSGTMMTFAEGYYRIDLPPAYNIDSLQAHFPAIHSSCNDNAQLRLSINVEECEGDGCDDGCEKQYTRTYEVYDDCINPYLYDQHIATVVETIYLSSDLHFAGFLKPEPCSDGNSLPRAYSTIEELGKAGASVVYTRDLSDVQLSHLDDENIVHGRKKRSYIATSTSCSELADTINQYFVVKKDNLIPFSYFFADVTMEGLADGYLEIYPPTDDEGCPDFPDNQNAWYTINLINQTEMEFHSYDVGVQENIFLIEHLIPGDYDLKIYARCPSCGFPNTPVYKASFTLKTRKMKVDVTDGLGLLSNHTYMTYHAQVSVTGPNDEYVRFEEYDKIMGRFTDEWELATGKLYSPNKKEWDLYEMYNPVMGGFGQYENILWQYQMQNEQFGHGLQRMIVAKDERYRVTYRLYKKGQRDGDHGPLFKEAYKNVYKEDLWCSNDPNEIFGPAGYTDADSTVVRMINANDDMTYTIQFENDPEFATAAAARVKITCPLDEHADPTTFRLGNFGFGEYTFEVPPLASYYNNRINMDSLGYWLDVTASVQVPENEAYWIFQTIDPATGMAPIDSLGFLPVNDTLLGNGEGFVTFTVSPKPGNNRSQISTGDTIVEQAQIYFDENEVVPTNRYKNMFDAVAPTSLIVCDTTGAHESLRLNVGFNAADDEGGSGVRYVELYANVDLAGYEMVAQMHPDSIYPFPLTDGTNFEFMGLAVDNVGNKEPYKPYHELFYCLGNPPRDMELSNNVFEENDALGTRIGDFITYDDQNTDNFVYALVDGPGSDDNNLFSIVGKELKTNYDFRCYGEYQYSIRVRTTDITNAYLEKTFTVFANQTEIIDPTPDYIYLCPGEGFYLHGDFITEPGVYLDTLSSQHGCDSVVRRIVRMNSAPVTTYADDAICFGYDYTENGFNIPADSLAVLTQGWDMQDEITLNLDNYVENAFHCYDTTRLTLTVRPAYDFVDEVLVCPTDLPYNYHGRLFYSDTTYMLRYSTPMGCDSTYTLQMTINPESGTQSDNLANGWNWYSTYIDQSNGRGLANLEAALGTHGRTIKSKTQFVQYSPEYNAWYGNLSGIDNIAMFKIQTDNTQVADVFGCFAVPDTIPLRFGQNWISFPMNSNVYVSQISTAVSGYPSADDVLKSKSSFAVYNADYGMWFGSLSVLTPGQGYMYKSNSQSEKYLYYPNVSRTEGHIVEVPEAHWVNNLHEFADNITILGLIELDGQAIESDSLEVGVFCNNEERGSGRAIYLEGLDAYRIFLTVQGEDGDELSFRLFDHNRDKERRIRCRQQLTFHADDHYGDLRSPYVIRFATDYDKLIEAEICEGQYYTENGFRAFRQGTYFKELTGQHGNDSIVRLDLTVNPVYQYEEEVVAVEFPFPYGELTFDRPGTYNLPFVTEHGCDSLVVLKVVPYEGARELLISPVPANRSDRVTLYFPFTRAEQQGLQVEVYTLAGSLMQYDNPTRFPIELKPFEVAGTYMVKVTMGTGEVVTGKIIVK